MTTQNLSQLKTILTNIHNSVHAVDRFIYIFRFYLEDLEEFKRDHPQLDAECLELLDKISTVLQYNASFLLPKLGFVYHNVFENVFRDHIHHKWSEEDGVSMLQIPDKSLRNFLGDDTDTSLFILTRAGIRVENTLIRNDVWDDLENDPEKKQQYCDQIAETYDRLGVVFSRFLSKTPEENTNSDSSPELTGVNDD